MAMTGLDTGETGRRDKALRRKYETGKVLRCANWVETVGAGKVEMLDVGAKRKDEWKTREAMEMSRRKWDWRCMLFVLESGRVRLCLRVGVSDCRVRELANSRDRVRRQKHCQTIEPTARKLFKTI